MCRVCPLILTWKIMANLEPKGNRNLILGTLKSAEENGGDRPTDA
jgi:hypothetical protein